MNVIYNENMIDNGKVEIGKARRIEHDDSRPDEVFYVKYNHKKAIEGVTYDTRFVKYDYGHDYEDINTMYIANTYLDSLLKYLKSEYIYFGRVYTQGLSDIHHLTFKKEVDKIDKVLLPEETNGFTMGVSVEKYINKPSGVMSSIDPKDGDYLIMAPNDRPWDISPETFFKRFEPLDGVNIIPSVSLDLDNVEFDKFKKIYNYINSLNIRFTFSTPTDDPDMFCRVRSGRAMSSTITLLSELSYEEINKILHLRKNGFNTEEIADRYNVDVDKLNLLFKHLGI